MNHLALRERFVNAKNIAERNLYYFTGKALDPQSFELRKSDQDSFISSSIVDTANSVIRYIHNHVVDQVIEKSATGDHVPKPDAREAITGLVKICAQQMPRLAPYASNAFKNVTPIGGAISLGIILGGAICATNPNIRNDLTQKISYVSHEFSRSKDKAKDELVARIEKMPSYSPQKVNI